MASAIKAIGDAFGDLLDWLIDKINAIMPRKSWELSKGPGRNEGASSVGASAKQANFSSVGEAQAKISRDAFSIGTAISADAQAITASQDKQTGMIVAAIREANGKELTAAEKQYRLDAAAASKMTARNDFNTIPGA